MKTYRNLSILIALATLTLCVLPMGRADEKKKTDEQKVQLMFV